MVNIPLLSCGRLLCRMPVGWYEAKSNLRLDWPHRRRNLGGRTARVQALVYIFIAIAALAVAGAGYFGLAFTPIDALLAALVFGCIAVAMVERTLRLRAQARLEKAIEDLSRLLSTDAQAGAVLSQRVSRLSDENAGKRIEALEADISVLGTVIRQVAEAVSDIEDRGRGPAVAVAAPGTAPERHAAVPPEPMLVHARPSDPEPVIPLEMLRQALAENRLVFHVQPVVTLPQRRPQSYDLLPRLLLEDGDLADGIDFLPRRGGEDVLRQIEGSALVEAVTIARRSRTGGAPVVLNVPLGPATLADPAAAEQLRVTIEANRALNENVVFVLTESAWGALDEIGTATLDRLRRLGIGFAISGVTTLRFDAAELSQRGVMSVRVPAGPFLSAPEIYTDLHRADVPAYLRRFDIDLVASNVASEREIVELLEDGIGFALGSHIAPPGPARADLVGERPRESNWPRRAELS
jgi:cyclic-di-GMP phosphodiesterase TipF (flagellum assembly factor)